MDTIMPSGLSQEQAQQHIRKYGLNLLAKEPTWYIFKELFNSFFSPLTLLLLVASLVSATLGDRIDFIIIFGIVVVSGGISFFQHQKAEQAAKQLKSKVVLTATVIRDGVQKEIPFPHITVGDTIILAAGDLVPADAKLLQAKEVSVDQSTLTGEAYPVKKNVSEMVFAGTHIVNGQAIALVQTIGRQTHLGQLSEKIVQQKPQTAFDRELESFSVLVVRLILVLAGFVFLVNAFFHHDFLSSLLFSVALAVGLTPELMPVIISVSLSRGALRMEEKEVIVKYLPSIQNLGGMDMLCMDKTGTITENAISLTSFENIQGEKDDSIVFLAKINSYFQSGFKNPLDRALLGRSAFEPKGYKKIDEIPFDFERKKLSIVVSDTKGIYTLITKGAPQKILENVSFFVLHGKKQKLSNQKREELGKKIDAFAKNGFRVIALATKPVGKKSHYSPMDEKNLVFLGFLVFTDPVKKTVLHTLQHLKSLGITPKILTGDNEIVTKKTCIDAGITVDNILTGAQIQKLSDESLAKHAETTTIFAGLDPEQKARIITVLRKKHTVGFLGDGINDAPPLKAADIGISVNNGSDIAKDVADIILMKKSLEALSEGVLEGRKTYVNTFKYIMMGLSSNFGNMMSVAIASLFLPFLPLLSTQILLINFFYDTSQITVPSDTVDPSTLLKPRQWSLGFLRRFTFTFGPLSSVFDLLTFSVLLLVLHASIPAFRTGWFVESLITQTLIVFAIRTHIVPFFKSKPSIYLILSGLLTLCAGVFIIFSPLGRYFAFVRLPNIFWVILVFEVLFYFTCVEVTKFFFYKKYTI